MSFNLQQCQQDSALCSRCRTAGWMSQSAALKTDDGQTAWVTWYQEYLTTCKEIDL